MFFFYIISTGSLPKTMQITMSKSKQAILKAAVEELRDKQHYRSRIIMHGGQPTLFRFMSFEHWANDVGPAGCRVGVAGLRELGIVVPFLPFFRAPVTSQVTEEEAAALCDHNGPLTWEAEELGMLRKAA